MRNVKVAGRRVHRRTRLRLPIFTQNEAAAYGRWNEGSQFTYVPAIVVPMKNTIGENPNSILAKRWV